MRSTATKDRDGWPNSDSWPARPREARRGRASQVPRAHRVCSAQRFTFCPWWVADSRGPGLMMGARGAGLATSPPCGNGLLGPWRDLVEVRRARSSVAPCVMVSAMTRRCLRRRVLGIRVPGLRCPGYRRRVNSMPRAAASGSVVGDKSRRCPWGRRRMCDCWG